MIIPYTINMFQGFGPVQVGSVTFFRMRSQRVASCHGRHLERLPFAFPEFKKKGGGTYPSHMGTSRDCKVTLVSSCNVKGPQGNAGQPME